MVSWHGRPPDGPSLVSVAQQGAPAHRRCRTPPFLRPRRPNGSSAVSPTEPPRGGWKCPGGQHGGQLSPGWGPSSGSRRPGPRSRHRRPRLVLAHVGRRAARTHRLRHRATPYRGRPSDRRHLCTHRRSPTGPRCTGRCRRVGRRPAATTTSSAVSRVPSSEVTVTSPPRTWPTPLAAGLGGRRDAAPEDYFDARSANAAATSSPAKGSFRASRRGSSSMMVTSSAPRPFSQVTHFRPRRPPRSRMTRRGTSCRFVASGEAQEGRRPGPRRGGWWPGCRWPGRRRGWR